MTISKYISIDEATHTNTGLANIPNEEQLAAMQHVATKVFDKCREHFNCALGVNSFFRSEAVNKAVGGAFSSQHKSGEAIDIDARKYGGTSNARLFHYIKDNLQFDQLIWEFGDNAEPAWVHVSLKTTGNRGEVLQAVKRNGKTIYVTWR